MDCGCVFQRQELAQLVSRSAAWGLLREDGAAARASVETHCATTHYTISLRETYKVHIHTKYIQATSYTITLYLVETPIYECLAAGCARGRGLLLRREVHGPSDRTRIDYVAYHTGLDSIDHNVIMPGFRVKYD